MKSNPIFLLFFALFITSYIGCDHDSADEETTGSLIEVLSEEEKADFANKLKSFDYLLSRPLEQRMARSKEYMRKYLELKDKDGPEALKALRISLYIHAKGDHPLLEEWVVLSHKIFREKEATLPDFLRATQIELQIARDNDESRKHIRTLEQHVEQVEDQMKDLKAQGIDLQEFKIFVKVEGDEDEE